jgi:type I restriction enzyme S subunit
MDSESLPLRRWDELGLLPDGTSFSRTFRAGQVLFGKRRAYQRKVSVPDFDGICSGDILVFAVSADELLQEYLPYIVQSDGFFEHALGTSAGSLSPRTKWQDLANYEFLLPSVDEQLRAVELLRQCDELIATYSTVSAAGQASAEAFRIHIAHVGEKHTLGELAATGGIQIGPFGSQLHAEEYTDVGIPVVMPSDLRSPGLDATRIRRVAEQTASRLSQHRMQIGDIVLPRRGELDKRALVGESEEGWLCGTGSVRVRLSEPHHAALVIQMLAAKESVRWLNDNSVGTTMPNLNSDIVNRIPLRLPKPSERAVWVTRLQGVCSTISLAEATKAEAQRLRMELLRTLCTGSSNVH